MRKYLAILCAAMLCVCCLALAACGGSSSGSASGSASASSSSADPTEKFIGEWQLSAMELGGATVYGDLSQASGWKSGSLTIKADGTGTAAFDETSLDLTWKLDSDDAIAIELSNNTLNSSAVIENKIIYKDDTLQLGVTGNDQTGHILYSKDGKIKGLDPITMDSAKDITNKGDLVGKWNLTGFGMNGVYAKGSVEALTTMMGSTMDTSLEFKDDGTVTVFGSSASWACDSNGAAITEGGSSIPVKALDDGIAMDLGSLFGSDMVILYSK